MGRKKVAAVVKLQIEAGGATPAPPVGTALGPHGVNIMDFCKAYNEETQQKAGQVVPVEITIFEDRSFSFITKTAPTSFLLKRAAGVETAAADPLRETAGTVTKSQVQEIAEEKMPDINANDIDAAMRMVEGTARSMGIKVV